MVLGRQRGRGRGRGAAILIARTGAGAGGRTPPKQKRRSQFHDVNLLLRSAELLAQAVRAVGTKLLPTASCDAASTGLVKVNLQEIIPTA